MSFIYKVIILKLMSMVSKKNEFSVKTKSTGLSDNRLFLRFLSETSNINKTTSILIVCYYYGILFYISIMHTYIHPPHPFIYSS